MPGNRLTKQATPNMRLNPEEDVENEFEASNNMAGFHA